AGGICPGGGVAALGCSLNGLSAILRHLPGEKAIVLECDPAVFDLTTRNIAHLSAPIELVPGSYKDLVGSRRPPADQLIVVFLGPPWGDALREAAFDWSHLRIYDVNAPGLQHGVLLGTRR